MTIVEPGADDDVSPWARDDWTATPTEPSARPVAGPPAAPAGLSPAMAIDEPPTSGPKVPSDGPSRARVLVAGAVGVGFLVFGAFAVLRPGDDADVDLDATETTVNSSSSTPNSNSNLTPAVLPAPTSDVAITVPPGADATRMIPASAVVDEVPTWTESTIDVPAPLDGLVAPTEMVVLTSDRLLERIDLPSGRVRSLNVADWAPNLKLALTDDAIVIHDTRYVAIIRDDEPIDLFEVPNGVLLLESWPGTRSLVVTSTGSTGEPGRFVMSTDDGSLQPVTADVSEALLFGAGNFLSTGDLLVNRPGGVYAIGPDQVARRISEGDLLAVGRNHYAIEACDESLQCEQSVVAAGTGVAVPALAGPTTRLGVVDPSTRIAPDGRSLVATDPTRDTGYRQIIDLATGSRVEVGRLSDLFYPDAWAADGSGLFVEDGGVVRFHARDTGEVVALDGIGVVESMRVRPGLS